MNEKDFYQQILGLDSPWFVADVKLDTSKQQVDIRVEHAEGTKFWGRGGFAGSDLVFGL